MRTAVKNLMLVPIGLILLGLIFTADNYARIDQESIAGIWLFEEGNGNETEDFSGNGNDGEFLGNPTWVDGKFGNALEFDGSNSVDCGDPRSLNIDGEALTLLAWVKPNTIQGLDAVIEKECGSDAAYNLYLNGGKVHFRMFANGNVWVEPGDTVPTDSWSHLAAVYDGSKMMVYIDGAIKGEANQNGNVTTNQVKFSIGASSNCGGRGFDGTLDEIAVFNIALTEDEINDVMTKGFQRINAVSPKARLATTWGRLKDDA